jgi:hypothetical protein
LSLVVALTWIKTTPSTTTPMMSRFEHVQISEQGQDWTIVAERAVQNDMGQMILTGQPQLKFNNIECQSEKIIQSPESLSLTEVHLKDLNIHLHEAQLSTFSQPTKIDDLELHFNWPFHQQMESMSAQQWRGPQSDLHTLMKQHQKLFDHREPTTAKHNAPSSSKSSPNESKEKQGHSPVTLTANNTQLLIARLRLRAKLKEFDMTHPHWRLKANQGHWTSPIPIIKLYGNIQLVSQGVTQKSSSGELNLKWGQLTLHSPHRVFELGNHGVSRAISPSKALSP